MRISDWSSDVCSSDLLRLRDIENVVDDGEQVIAALVDVLDVVAVVVAADRPEDLLQDELREADDGVQRRAQLVAHGGQEVALGAVGHLGRFLGTRSEEHTSELQSLMRISYAVFCLKQKKHK